MVAEIAASKFLAPAITAITVPFALTLFMRSAQRESIAKAGSRTVAYPFSLRLFVIAGWLGVIVLWIFGAYLAENADPKNASMIAALFGLLLLPLHLEVFGVLITWDDANIYTKSPWRKSRSIPLNSILSCDYSVSMQWYRVQTQGYGVVRIHSLTRGIAEFLTALPCAHPPFPPHATK